MITNADERPPLMPTAYSAIRLAPAFLVMALLFAGLSGCNEATVNEYSGTIQDDVFEIQIPALPTPAVDVNAWEQSARTQQAAGAGRPTGALALSTGPRSRVASAPVEEGDRVEVGQTVAILDDALLRAAVQQARTAAKRSRSDVAVIEQRLDDVASGKTTIAEKRADVASTISDLNRTRSDLVAKRAEARAALAQLERIPLPPPGSVPPTLPPGTPDPNAVRSNITQLRAGIAQMDAAIARIDSGLAQARGGLGQIDSSRQELNDAQAQLTDLSKLAEIGADASAVAVDLAEAQLEMATLRSPVNGVVVSVTRVGSVLAAGAPAVSIRADRPRRIRIWLPPDRIGSVAVGDAAQVRLDSLEATYEGRVSRIGVFAGFPPTSLATSEIHLTRATDAEITLDTTEQLPPGVPADVVILTR